MSATLMLLERALVKAGHVAGSITLPQLILFISTIILMLLLAAVAPFIMGPPYTVPKISVPTSPGKKDGLAAMREHGYFGVDIAYSEGMSMKT